MNKTKKSHYIPCFWSSLWNKEYYDNFINNRKNIKCRFSKIYYLNIRSGEIIGKNTNGIIVENVFKYNNGRYPYIEYYTKDNLKIESIDNESIYTVKEDIIDIRKTILKYTKEIENKKIEALSKIDFLFFILFQFNNGNPKYRDIIRKAYIDIYNVDDTALIEAEKEFGKNIKDIGEIYNLEAEKLLSIYFKKLISRTLMKKEKILLYYNIWANCEWIFYYTNNHSFPLSDNPIYLDNKRLKIMCPISPRILLEVNANKRENNNILIKKDIYYTKMKEYRNKIISQCYEGIISHDINILEEWIESECFNKRRKLLK